MPATAAQTMRAPARPVEGGNGRFAFHVDAFDRETSKERIPGFAHSDRHRALDGSRCQRGLRQPAQQRRPLAAAALGGACTWADGYAGLSYNGGFEANYGSVAEDDVRLRACTGTTSRLRRKCAICAGRSRSSSSISATRTTSTRRSTTARPAPRSAITGYEARIEARHRKIRSVRRRDRRSAQPEHVFRVRRRGARSDDANNQRRALLASKSGT